MELDDVDHRILTHLKCDGRASHAAIARDLGMTGPAVYARIHRMEEGGVIRNYSVNIDPAALGEALLVFVRVTTRPRIDENDAFEGFVMTEPRIIECHDVDGEDSYILKIRCGSPAHLRTLLAEIRSLPQVIRTVSSIALVTVKEPGMRTRE